MPIIAPDEQNHVEALDRHYRRDRGLANDAALIWRRNDSTYILDADNAGGNHANFGTGVFVIQDSAISTEADMVYRSGKKATFNNAGNSNAANLYHSGTSDVLKTDDGLLIATTLNVGGTISATDSGDGFLSGGLSLGTYVNPAAGDLILSAALNVGNARSATAAGEAWIQTGLSVGTYTSPGTGEVKTSGSHLALAVATSGAYTSDSSYRGLCRPYAGSVTNGNKIAVDTQGGSALLYLWDSGSGTATVVSLAGGANTVQLQGLSTATWNVNSDAGATWAVFHDGSNYVVKNRSGSTRSFIGIVLG